MGRGFHIARAAFVAATLGAFATPALAVCPTSNQFKFLFNSQPATTLSYGSSYTYAATNGLGQSQSLTLSLSQNGLSNTAVNSIQLPAIGTLINDDNASRFLVIGGIFAARTPAITGGADVVVTTMTFAAPVRDVTFAIADIDFTNNQFRDWLIGIGRNGAATYTPTIVTPWGQANNGGTLTNASSSLTLGPTSTPYAVGAAEAVGTGNSNNNSNTGNITLSFPQPITSIEFRYGNYPLQSGETATGQQAIGFSGVSYCPMPSLTVTKTSAPYVTASTDPLRFNVPGADVIYTLTVTNANTSPVDMSTMVLTDALPAGVSFYNGDIDDAGPLTTNYAFDAGTSGLSFSASGLTYSNNGGTSYAYTPAAGYDAAVTALRFAPVGSMPADSSFTLRFRAQIK